MAGHSVLETDPSRNMAPLHDPRDPEVRLAPPPSFLPPTDEEWERLAAHEGIYALILVHGSDAVEQMVVTGDGGPDGLHGTVEKYGRDRVVIWVRSLATIAGEER